MNNKLKAWDDPQLDPFSSPPDDFQGLEIEDAVEVIKDWFLENFEDPAHETPHSTGEGGYLYIWGGPYDTRDVISNVFADTASEELIEAAIDAVEAQGTYDWAPHGRRVRPPDDRGIVDANLSNPVALHSEMLERISALEEAMANLPPPAASIGHNNPPESINVPPFSGDDREEITQALAILKSQPVEPEEIPKEATEVAGRLKDIGEKIRAYAVTQGDTFVSAAVESAGSETGKWAIRLSVWGILAERLIALSRSVYDWLNAINLPF